MAKFKLEIEVDNDNTWMRTEFSLGVVIERVGKNIRDNNPSFQDMFRNNQEIKDAYGNIVGHYEMYPYGDGK